MELTLSHTPELLPTVAAEHGFGYLSGLECLGLDGGVGLCSRAGSVDLVP
jgi:hypothetical protein